MLRILTRCNELPIVVKQLQKVCGRPKPIATTDRTICMLAKLRRQNNWPFKRCSSSGDEVKTLSRSYSSSFLGFFQNANPIAQKTNKFATEATVQVNRPYKLHRLEHGPETSVTLTKEQAIKYYTQMQTIRRIETGN